MNDGIRTGYDENWREGPAKWRDGCPLNRRQACMQLVVAAAASSLSLKTASGWLDESQTHLIAPRKDLDKLYDQEVDDAVRAGLAFLIHRQNEDGTFASKDQGRWVGVVSLAGLAFLSRGVRSGVGVAGRALQRAGEYVLSQTQPSGFISAHGETSHGPMYDHGFGALFLAELYGMAPELRIRPKLEKAVRLITQTQNKNGGWRYNPSPPDQADLSVTVCQMMAMRAARNAGIGVPKETISRAVEYVQRSQNPDGGFMYQLQGGASRFPITAAAVVALYNAGIYQGAEIDAAMRYLEQNSPKNARIERNNFFFYAHYYSTQAFWHRGGKAWERWYTLLKETLLNSKKQKGEWFDFNSVEYGTAMACLILNMPRTVLPIFQR